MQPTLKIEIDEKYEKLGVAVQEILRRAIKLTATELWGQVKQEAPVDHGRLAGSFAIDQINPLSWQVYTNVEYALAVHEGTGPHDIYPVHKKALYWPGADHPVKHVSHPGTAANPFGDRAISNTEERIDDFTQIAIDEIMREHEL